MSKKSRKHWRDREDYFAYLAETARLVDPYVRETITTNLKSLPWLEELLLSRYRFGKAQLRPAIVRMGYELAGGKDWPEIIPACAAIEAKDTGYYCYDEMIDICNLDLALMVMGHSFHDLSWVMIDDLKASSDLLTAIRHELLCLDLNNMNGVRIEAEMAKTGSLDEDKYMAKARGLNFWESALRIGAILGKADTNTIDLIGQVGQLIGTAYILANDTWEFGKDTLEDFQSGKMTLPIIFALRETGAEDKAVLRSLLGKQHSQEEVELIRKIMVRSGAITYGKKRAWELCEIATALLAQFSESRARNMLLCSMTMTQQNKYYRVLDQY